LQATKYFPLGNRLRGDVVPKEEFSSFMLRGFAPWHTNNGSACGGA